MPHPIARDGGVLLELAGVAPPHADAPIAGRSMMGVLSGKSPQIHADDEAIGYEAAGGAAGDAQPLLQHLVHG